MSFVDLFFRQSENRFMMFRQTSHIFKKASAPAICALAILTACSGGSKTDPEAQSLFDGASQAFENADYSRATLLLDSLQKKFPAEISLQKESMALRPKVIEKATLLKISTNDSLMAFDKVEADRLKPKLKWIKTPRMLEGYWVAAQGYNPSFMSTTAIQGRVSEIGEFYIVSSAKPALGHTSISLSDGTSSAATPDVPYDGESNYRIDGGEIITFSPAQSDTVGQFALAGSGKPLTLSFRGKSSRDIKLSPAQVSALADTYAYARAVRRARELAVERQKLEATLQVARDQIARTSAESISPAATESKDTK